MTCAGPRMDHAKFMLNQARSDGSKHAASYSRRLLWRPDNDMQDFEVCGHNRRSEIRGELTTDVGLHRNNIVVRSEERGKSGAPCTAGLHSQMRPCSLYLHHMLVHVHLACLLLASLSQYCLRHSIHSQKLKPHQTCHHRRAQNLVPSTVSTGCVCCPSPPSRCLLSDPSSSHSSCTLGPLTCTKDAIRRPGRPSRRPPPSASYFA